MLLKRVYACLKEINLGIDVHVYSIHGYLRLVMTSQYVHHFIPHFLDPATHGKNVNVYCLW